MEDSEVELPQEPPVEKPSGPTPVLMRTRHGTVIERLRDEKGRLVKNRKQIPDTREVTQLMRTFLRSRVANADGKIDKGCKKRVEKMINRIYEISTNDNDDPKAMMAAVKAFEILMLRSEGKPNISDEEKDALQRSGVRIVVINAPEGLQVVEDKPKERLKPSFIEAEFVENTNASKNG